MELLLNFMWPIENMYTIDDLHYNSRNVIQISPNEDFEDLASTLNALDEELRNGSRLEQNMLSFFHREVEPLVAYKDNDVSQGAKGPRRLFVVGKLKKINDDIGLFVRLGIRSLGENPLIPALQALYLQPSLHTKYLEGKPVGLDPEPDRWVYDFTDRYQGMVEGVRVRSRLGIRSLSVIPAINEAILTGALPRLESPKYE